MTLLMWSHAPNYAAVFTDTLVTDTSRGNSAAMYRSKVWTYPHLNLVMAVTGIADLGDAWDSRIRRISGVRDIDGLNKFAQDELRQIFAELNRYYGEQFPDMNVGTATVYLFGFPHGSEQLVRYAYRSMKDFESERYVVTEPRFAVKPAPQTFEMHAPETMEEIIEMAERVRAENGDGTEEGTVAIGGELYITQLEPNRITTERVYRFPGYEEVWQDMLDWWNTRPEPEPSDL